MDVSIYLSVTYKYLYVSYVQYVTWKVCGWVKIRRLRRKRRAKGGRVRKLSI